MTFLEFAGIFFILVWPGNSAMINKEDPGNCNSGNSGKIITLNDKDGNERVLICLKRNTRYFWRELDDFPTLGEFFNPAKDCSDIAQRNQQAQNGFYWIKPPGVKDITKVWCDVTTDGGGFMLVGYKDSPKSWTVPSDDSLLSPQGSPHWSSAFGNVFMLEFRIQVSTTKNFTDTKADWLYRFTTPRHLTELLMSDKGGCTKHYPGIGNIEYVKDLLAGKIVTQNYQCSRFGPSYPSSLGWNLMNTCLGKPCKKGFAIVPGTNFQYDNFGGFSYSTNIPRSGIIHNSTTFIGCDHGQCCACFGPKGAKGDFCSPGCNKINGGTVTGSAQAWFWIRSTVPKRPTWKKCMEYEVQTADGKTESHFIDENSGIAQKGSCIKKGVPNFVDGLVKVANKAAMDKLPPIEGLISYRKDNAKLYVTDGQSWEALGKEKQDKVLENKLSREERKILNISSVLQEFRKANTKLEDKLEVLEERLNNITKGPKSKSCKEILLNHPGATSGVHWIKPQGGSFHSEFQVYCDMVTHGGGWTLVYSYTFTNYNNFVSTNNAVTPRPNWPASGANVPISTSPPLSESSRGAVNFNLWKEIGKEFLIKSNINDWIVCQSNGGSLVTKKDGPLSCQNIKNVATKCQGKAPNRIGWRSYGPSLFASSFYYYFDGSTSGDYPTHDPCGTNNQHQTKGVSYPRGTIFIR